ncbi:MAG: pyridoxamine 5-phosphate oxidase [Planctomycetaceae bacterium]|mgnify:CR=1 FL=1|nr:pyridoxamine 5-phosphate oxidase [Planctomycetaceae bacterium]|tara:strand:- start:286 stop:939 length:654 start_codon:yes stop_codon:yes gene_type:complete
MTNQRNEQSESETPSGSRGEHILQEKYGTSLRAKRFYARQVVDHLNDEMHRFVSRMEMMFVSTSDSQGECDCTIRCGLPGFVVALDDKTVVYPELRGNGVMASLGNLTENPHIGLLLVDFFETTIGLHLNGKAEILENKQLLEDPRVTGEIRVKCEHQGGRKPERWVQVTIDEAYIHCSKHIPLMKRMPKEIAWGTDDESLKGGDFFGISCGSQEQE